MLDFQNRNISNGNICVCIAHFKLSYGITAYLNIDNENKFKIILSTRTLLVRRDLWKVQ